MKSQFVGYFRPKDTELSELWANCIFAIDANVLLNLYRYSSATRAELEKALNSFKDRVYIPHQAAKEFLKNRLIVTAGQANEYSKAIGAINDLLSKLSSTDRHPFLPEGQMPEFEEYAEKLTNVLKEQQDSLLENFSNDEILDYVDQLFDGKTGASYNKEELEKIEIEGEHRYEKDIPPGYKDGKKDGSGDPLRKYGDLILWKQVIDHAKTTKKPIILITDDKKEDWWLEQSGRTIGPRPEIIEEFYSNSEQKFWMYSVDRFLQEAAKSMKETVSQDIIDEILKIRLDSFISEFEEKPSISVAQEGHEGSDNCQSASKTDPPSASKIDPPQCVKILYK